MKAIKVEIRLKKTSVIIKKQTLLHAIMVK